MNIFCTGFFLLVAMSGFSCNAQPSSHFVWKDLEFQEAGVKASLPCVPSSCAASLGSHDAQGVSPTSSPCASSSAYDTPLALAESRQRASGYAAFLFSSWRRATTSPEITSGFSGRYFDIRCSTNVAAVRTESAAPFAS